MNAKVLALFPGTDRGKYSPKQTEQQRINTEPFGVAQSITAPLASDSRCSMSGVILLPLLKCIHYFEYLNIFYVVQCFLGGSKGSY